MRPVVQRRWVARAYTNDHVRNDIDSAAFAIRPLNYKVKSDSA